MRSSNIELLRIVSMLLIILHHFCVHGNWPEGILASNVILDVLSFGGKLGVNCFILITGYFMVASRFKIMSLIRVISETIFYSASILAVFLITGSESIDSISLTTLVKSLLPTTSGLYWFVTVYVGLYIFIPLLNLILNKIDETAIGRLITVSFFALSALPTLTTFNPIASNLVWFFFLHLVGGAIRLYYPPPKKKARIGDPFNPIKLVANTGTCKVFIGSCFFIFIYATLANLLNIEAGEKVLNPRYYMSQNSVPLVYASISLFVHFKESTTLSIPIINKIAGTTFGIYLIHDNPFIRHWLWPHFTDLYYFNPALLAFAALGVSCAVFIVCSAFDFARTVVQEKPLMIFLNNKCGHHMSAIDNYINSIGGIASKTEARHRDAPIETYVEDPVPES